LPVNYIRVGLINDYVGVDKGRLGSTTAPALAATGVSGETQAFDISTINTTTIDELEELDELDDRAIPGCACAPLSTPRSNALEGERLRARSRAEAGGDRL
jgi:hypothetical protein